LGCLKCQGWDHTHKTDPGNAGVVWHNQLFFVHLKKLNLI
jgi:hypothetical protein